MLIYDGLTSEYEEYVKEDSVEPLVIEDVIIKAKKKYWAVNVFDLEQNNLLL